MFQACSAMILAYLLIISHSSHSREFTLHLLKNLPHIKMYVYILLRADTEKSRMMDLLNTSLTHPHPVPCSTHCPVQSNPVLQGLSSELRALKNELMETQFGVTKTEATTASIESRVKHIEQKVHAHTYVCVGNHHFSLPTNFH